MLQGWLLKSKDINTYRVFGVHTIRYSSLLSGSHNSRNLDGDAVPKSFAFAVYDAWYEDVASHSERFSGINHDIVRCHSLRIISR